MDASASQIPSPGKNAPCYEVTQQPRGPLNQAVHVSSWSSDGGSPWLLLDLELGPHDVSSLKFQIHIFTVIFTTRS